MQTPYWKAAEASFNVELLKTAGLTVSDYQEYLYHCISWFEDRLKLNDPQDQVNALVGMLQHCALFVANIPDDQASAELHQSIKDWLIIHGPPLCIGNDLTNDGSADPAAELQVIAAFTQAQLNPATIDPTLD